MFWRLFLSFVLIGFSNPGWAANLLCSGFTIRDEFYRSKAALSDFQPEGWEAKPFIVKDFPDGPTFHTGDNKFKLRKVASSGSPWQGDLYLVELGKMYMIWEFFKDLEDDRDVILYYTNPSMTYESKCDPIAD